MTLEQLVYVMKPIIDKYFETEKEYIKGEIIWQTLVIMKNNFN